MAEFDPRQLDQLEDALERLDGLDDLGSLELDPALHERLGEYQDVLELCRDAFPLEAPGDVVLSEVIAEAHEVTRRAQRTPQPGGWRRFWDRWRGTLIPGVALAGTAAAILLLLEPKQKLEQARDLLQDDPSSERAGSAEDTPSKPASGSKAEAALEPASPDGDDNGEPAPPDGAGAGEQAGGADGPSPSIGQVKKPTHKKGGGGGGAGIEPTLAVEPEPLSKDDTWTRLEQANGARRKGSCDHARELYQSVIAASSDNQAVARAKAGIGLCFEQDQRDGEADDWFDKARATSPAVDAWINTERGDQPMPGEFAEHERSKKSPVEKSPSKKTSKLD